MLMEVNSFSNNLHNNKRHVVVLFRSGGESVCGIDQMFDNLFGAEVNTSLSRR